MKDPAKIGIFQENSYRKNTYMFIFFTNIIEISSLIFFWMYESLFFRSGAQLRCHLVYCPTNYLDTRAANYHYPLDHFL